MEATYRLKYSELNEDFLKVIRKLFKNKEIDITISTSNKEDEVEFLKSMEDIKLRRNLISFSVDELKAFSEKLMQR